MMQAKYTMISTASGVHDNVPHPTALKRYQDNTSEVVYRTDVDGSWKFTF
jgi:beta-lactamase superfamily II metal-dependent hydrolase